MFRLPRSPHFICTHPSNTSRHQLVLQGGILALSASFSRRSVTSITSITKRGPDLFEYTSGRWLYNESLRKAERAVVFNVDELCRLAAQSVDRDTSDVLHISKLGEGGFNRAFLITMKDKFQMVARIPYPVASPKSYAVASEAATMDFLRSAGMPVARVYGYSNDKENASGTEYIFMKYIKSIKLSSVWSSLSEQEMISIDRELAQIEARITSISFPAGGSIYYTSDLEDNSGTERVLLDDERFCMGPDTRLALWYNKRAELTVPRGPYMDVEAALAAPAVKELAYLKQYGRPILPFRRERRSGYQNQKQSPSEHAVNLERYLMTL